MPLEAPIPFNAVPLLSALRKEDRDLLAPLCRLRAYDKGEIIFNEGDPADRIHFVVIGQVKIVKAAGGRDVIIEILGPGEPVGAVAVFERRPFPASAVALEPSSILSLPEREFFALVESRLDVMRRLLAGLTYRLIMVNKRLADMTGSAERHRAALSDAGRPHRREAGRRRLHPDHAVAPGAGGPDRDDAGDGDPPDVAVAEGRSGAHRKERVRHSGR